MGLQSGLAVDDVDQPLERLASREQSILVDLLGTPLAAPSLRLCSRGVGIEWVDRAGDAPNARSKPDGSQTEKQAQESETGVMAERPIIRPADRADWDQWLPLWNGYNAFYGRVGPTALPADITATTWARFFDAYEQMRCLVAEQSGRLIGLTHYLFHRSTRMLEPTCYLQDLFTSEAARGRGVGRALIETVYARAKAAGATHVYWHTHETNTAARRLYDQVAQHSGFIVYRRDL